MLNSQLCISYSAIRDNHSRGTVGEFLKENIQKGANLSIVSAYFTIHAFEALKNELLLIDRLNFLFGEPEFILDPHKNEKKWFLIERDGLKLQNQLQQKRLARECADWIRDKVQIKSVRESNLLHGKMYHIATQVERTRSDGSKYTYEVESAIMGSSNFTIKGLGLSAKDSNIELNLIVRNEESTSDIKNWFDEIWKDDKLVEDVKDKVLLYLKQVYTNYAPEFIYYKTLFHVFEQFLLEQQESGLLTEKSQIVDTQIWKSLFEFQKHGAIGAINKILNHNGCIIADSVGLGKTYEALAVIKYFELLNYRVLVLSPKKLRDNWTMYQAQNNSELNQFIGDRFSYTVLSHTDLCRESGKSGDIDLATINWGNYDLVVIDESHNFRNYTKGKRDEDGNIIRKSRYERLMDDIIKSGIKTKVLLLSATPVNNNLTDLRHQIEFLTEGKDDAFKDSIGVVSLKDTLANAQRNFTNWAKKSKNRKTSDLLNSLDSGFFKLLDELTIARSRKHIQKYYKDVVAQLGGFPERLKPLSIFSKIDLKGRFMSYDKLNDEISNYQLSLFNPSKYVLNQYKEEYEHKSGQRFKQSVREHFLIGMMKVNFLKRLESSVTSFAITMERTIDKIEALQQRIERFKQFRDENHNIDFNQLNIEDIDDEELQEAMEVGQRLILKIAHLDIDAWLEDLEQDKQQLNILYSSALQVDKKRDAKLTDLKKLIENKVKQPTINKQDKPNRKVLVFTAFADTAEYLYNALQEWIITSKLNIHIALVAGGTGRNKTTFGKNEFNQILTNFSPISKKRDKMKSMPLEGEIDLLIATDCISEGQNLQDCDYLVNYDIHWNPVRIIQRFGRIDRIGNINHTVQLVNFWATDDLNKYINLKNRVEARMALVDIAATFEDNLLEPDEIEELIQTDLKYRDKQLLRLQNEVLDLEDFNESVALNEFTLDDFRIELSKYLERNRKQLEDAPLGIYTVVPLVPENQIISSGVIFCLKQKGGSSRNETVNPLQPYFLVYIRDDKVVRFTFAQPKQILEMFRLLCVDKMQAYNSLCDLFDKQTNNGADMSFYNDLLQGAVDSITRTFKKRLGSNLFKSGKGAVMPEQKKQVTSKTDFDLISWLVIKDE
ncbi:ATP-dependent helicase [Scytonema hofmannii PCC 7110]|uniref:ATP-dependent helicase n=2 Tax=Scytonema hofmannii TaxID=34078 RepID=A0A139X243_9CYAN|nr:ATP-dependent helicase [Scytonema hofmannii PCC 7110]